MAMALYLNHYLGSVHHMPSDLRRNFSLMHDLDVRVQSLIKKIDHRSCSVLSNIDSLSEQEKYKQRKKIHHLFHKARKYADIKTQIAIDSYGLIGKFVNRLDGDMEKYRAILTAQKKKASKKDKKTSKKRAVDSSADDPEHGVSRKKRCTGINAESSGSTSGYDAEVGATSGGAVPFGEVSGSTFGYNAEVGEVSGGVVSAGGSSGEGTAMADGQAAGEGDAAAQASEYFDMDVDVDANEPTYCVCNQVSYGEMIACDNPKCAIEWFHFPCVGLIKKPTGDWYCTKCNIERKSKARPGRRCNRPKFVIKPK